MSIFEIECLSASCNRSHIWLQWFNQLVVIIPIVQLQLNVTIFEIEQRSPLQPDDRNTQKYTDYVITMISTSSFYVSKSSVSTSFTSIIHINFYGEHLGVGSTNENLVLPVHWTPSWWGIDPLRHRDQTSSSTWSGPPHRFDHPCPTVANSPYALWNRAAVANWFCHRVCRAVATNGSRHWVRCATGNGCHHWVWRITTNGYNGRLPGPPLSTPHPDLQSRRVR
jgi:hypothetical protein